MSEYFDYSSGRLVPGTTARASAVNTVFDALDTGLDKLPDPDHIKRGKLNYAVATGTSNAIVVALGYAPLAYEDGMEVVFKATGTNTSAATINVNALGARSIRRQDGTVLVAGDITNAKIHTIRYNSTSGYFEIQGSPVGTGGAGTMATQNASAVAITGGTIGGEDVEDVGEVVGHFADVLGVTIPKQIILQIGNWDMDASEDVVVDTIIDEAKIVGIRAYIRADTGDAVYPIDFPDPADAHLPQGSVYLNGAPIGNAQVTLTRKASGLFDGNAFDSASFNRGWIIIDYVD